MKRLLLLFSLAIFSLQAHSQIQDDLPKSIHGFKITTLAGDELDLSSFKGKKILIVNTASKCGFTPQYEDLEKLYREYKDKIVVIGFPANDFMKQEPGSNEKIAEFCSVNYGVTFPMSEKISVKGRHTAPIYAWLTQKKYNKVEDSSVDWNFHKYLIDENGNYLASFQSKVKPTSPEILAFLED